MDVLRRAAGYLTEAGSPTARLDAELLVGQALGLSRLELYLQFERPMAETELAQARALVRRRAGGDPVAYLVGHKEFCGLEFEVSRAVLIPRPESELLVEISRLRLAPRAGQPRCADLGTGSGCVAIAIAARSAAAVDAVDISPAAVKIARSNAQRLGVSERVPVFQGSWEGPLVELRPYDLVVSNPPYLTSAEADGLAPGVRDQEPRVALDAGPDGLDSYRALIPGLSRLVDPGAVVLLEVDPSRAGEVAGLCAAVWPRATTQVHRDLSGRNRVVEVTIG